MSSRILQFGTFQADLDSGELYRDGIKLKLGGQPFQVLQYLLSRPGDVVTREELRDAVWKSVTFGDFDHGLNTAINKIREALGDSAANPRFVETVPRRGYRFIAPVDPPAAPFAPIEPPPPSAKAPSRKRIRLAAGGAGVALLAAGFVTFRLRPPAPVDYKLTQVTRDSSLTWQPGISADGNFVVYASDRATGKDLDIWIQHVSGSQPIRLTSTSADESYPSISADGRTVAFQVEQQSSEKGIFIVPALGGTPKLLAASGRQPQISPAGTSVAYSTGEYGQASELRMVSTEGGPAKKIPAGLEWAMSPVWMGDRRNLLVWAGCGARSKAGPCDYWIVPAAGGIAYSTGAEQQLRKVGAANMARSDVSAYPFPTTSAGVGGVVIAARSGDGHDLWWLPMSDGKAGSPATRITVGAGAAHPSVAATGRIAFSRLAVNTALWMLPLEASSGRVTGELQRVGRENASMNYPSVSGDGKKLVYVSNRGGDPDVWIRDLETGADRQLTASKANEFRAVLSPDGGRVAFGDRHQFYTMPSSGGVGTMVCADCGSNVVGWSPDGRKLLFYRGNPIRHATVDLATGEKRDVVWHPTADIHNGRISPDGRWITFTLVGEARRVIYVASLVDGGGGKPESWIRISGESQARSSFWSPDGNLLYIHDGGALWARRLQLGTKTPIGEPFLVQRFNGPRFSPLFSANGLAKDALYFLMLETTSNVWIADPVIR